VKDTNTDSISIFNAQFRSINVRVTAASLHNKGGEEVRTIEPGESQKWVRSKEEVIYVNGPAGNAVGAYYGMLGNTLIPNCPM
jgi:hypothetical protein